MFARIDDGKYQTGLAKCTNFLVEPQGPITMRPGFAFVNKTKSQDKPPRLIPFTFSTDQTMVLEFGNKYIRFHTQGQTMLGSSGSPYEVTTPYSIDDVFDIHYVQSADVMTLVHTLYPPMELRRYGATDWRLVEIEFESSLSAPTGVTATQHINADVSNKTDYVREYAVTALLSDGSQESVRSASAQVDCNPYGDGAYNTISWNAVSGAGLYRVYRNEGGIWAFIGQTTGTSIRDENIDPDASITPPLYDSVFSQARGIESVTVTNSGSGYVGSQKITGHSNIINMTETFPFGGEGSYYLPLCYGATGDLSKYSAVVEDQNGGTGSGATAEIIWRYAGDATWWIDGFKITNAGSGYSNPRIVGKVLEYQLGGGQALVTFCTCAATVETSDGSVTLEVSDSTGTGAVLVPTVVDGKISSVYVASGGQNYTSPTIKVISANGSGATFSVQVGSDSGDYPGAVTYFEQRRWFGGTLSRPSNLWATKSGTESDMSYSLPTQDDDRIAVRVAARDANRIQHMVPLSQLMLLTSSAEWRVSPLNSDAITPSSMSVRPQSYVGANNVQPLVVSSTMIYAAARGGHLRECGYSYEAGGYITNDICLRAPHLFDAAKVVDMAYSKAPWPLVFTVNNLGELIALTYVPEQQVGAFSVIETNNGKFRSCCVVAEGDEDILYCVVERIIAGEPAIYIERMTERNYTTLNECNFLDSSGTYEGEPKTEITGLTWLEDMEVSIVADGGVEPRQVVKNGKITLSQPASIVHVGIPYTADAQTLPVAVAFQDGSYGSGHRKNVRSMSFRVVNSSGIQAGPSFDSLTEYPARSIEPAGQAPYPITDEFDLEICANWSTGGQVCVRQAYPLPMKIIAMTTVVEIV